MRFRLSSVLFFCLSFVSFAQQKDNWENLFDGKSLTGWQQLNGTAKYEVLNGEIIGTTVPDSPNSFLCTDKDYGNFILELDFWVDEELNSGIQIRSESLKSYQNGRVHGYQVEIDPAQKEMYSAVPFNRDSKGNIIEPGSQPRRWTGGIYDEGRRKWLVDLTNNESARNAFKPGKWNHFRIEAIGDGIRTYLNGVFAAGLVDAMTPNGFIALQVHASKSEKPLQVKWKNIRIQDLGFNDSKAETPQQSIIGDWISADGKMAAQIYKDSDANYRSNLIKDFNLNSLPIAVLSSDNEGREFAGDGWKAIIEDNKFSVSKDNQIFVMQKIVRNSPTLNAPPPDNAVILFDGTTMAEWSKQKYKEWTEKDGQANNWKLLPGGKIECVPAGYSIISNRVFGNFKLHAEFRLLDLPVNGGIYLQSRYEINIKDSYGQMQGAPCAAPGNVAIPSLPADMVNPSLPPSQWQTIDVEFFAPKFDSEGKTKISNAKLRIYLNGVKIVKDFEPEKLKGAATRLGEAPFGPIMLQEHGTAYQFRNIWIEEMK